MLSSLPLQHIYSKTNIVSSFIKILHVSIIFLSKISHVQDALPVAIKTGYIDEYDVAKARSQVIVVVFDDWTVACYDSHLTVMWEKVLGNKSHEMSAMNKYYKISEVSVHISPLDIHSRPQEDSKGLIIVGASMVKRAALKGEAVLAGDEGDLTVKLEEGLSDEQSGDEEHPDMAAEAVLGHFNIYALEGTTGHVLWRHDGVEVISEQYSKSLPQHAYSLDMSDLMSHTHHAAGINHWSIFRQSLIDELPHVWNHPADTTMRIAHFVRRHVGGGAGQQIRKKAAGRGAKVVPKGKKSKEAAQGKKGATHADITTGKGRNGKQATKLASTLSLLQPVEEGALMQGASLPHSAVEHTLNPNVVVVHTSQGIEVIALRTGIPITSLALNKRLAYDDVDGDGVIDSALVVDWSAGLQNPEVAHHFATVGKEAPHCTLVVLSGLPVQSELFRGSICAFGMSLHDPNPNNRPQARPPRTIVRDGVTQPNDGKKISYTTPLIVRKLDGNTLRESRQRDVVTAIHSGIVTSFSGSGALNWQHRSGPTWDVDNDVAKSTLLLDADASRVADLGSHSSVYANILVSGEDRMQLLDREGEVLAAADIPQPPVATPAFGDFDSDGVTDVIVVCDGAVLGYRLVVTQASQSVAIAIGILAFIALLVFVGSIQSGGALQGSEGEEGSASASISRRSKPMRGKGAQSIFRIVRSTDETHND